MRKYLKRFNDLALETPGINSKVKALAFVNGLKGGQFFSSFAKKMTRTFDRLLTCVHKYIQLEDAIMAKEADAAVLAMAVATTSAQKKEENKSLPSESKR